MNDEHVNTSTLVVLWRAASRWLLIMASTIAASADEPPQTRLRVSDNGRFLVTADGKPFFWLGDTAWHTFGKSVRDDSANQPSADGSGQAIYLTGSHTCNNSQHNGVYPAVNNTAPPAADGRKVIISDVDHVWPRNFPQWPWKSFTRGLNTAFMDLYGATKIGDKEIKELNFVGDWLGNHEMVRQRMGHTLALAQRVNLAAMWKKDLKQVLDECIMSHLGIPVDRWDWTPGQVVHDNRDWYPTMPGYGAFLDPPYHINGQVVRGGPGWVVMSAKDLARWGLLVATGGHWKGKRLISSIQGHGGGNGSHAGGTGGDVVGSWGIVTSNFVQSSIPWNLFVEPPKPA